MNPCSVLCCVKNSLGPQWDPVLYEAVPVEKPGDPEHKVIVHREVELAEGRGAPIQPPGGRQLRRGRPAKERSESTSTRELARTLILKFLFHADEERGLSAGELSEAVMAGASPRSAFERARKKLADESAIQRFQEKGSTARPCSTAGGCPAPGPRRPRAAPRGVEGVVSHFVNGETANDGDRVDGRHLEPGDRLRPGLAGMRPLLRGDVR